MFPLARRLALQHPEGASFRFRPSGRDITYGASVTMPNRIVRVIRKRITRALHVELEFSLLQRGLEQAWDSTLELIPLASSRTMARRLRRRAKVIVRANLGLPGLQQALERSIEGTLERMPVAAPQRLVHRVRRRARVILKANLSLANMQRGLAQAVDEGIEQIPLRTPRGIARIIRNRATRVMKTDVGISELQRGLGRILKSTLKGIPVDPDLLVKQGSERSRHLNRQLAWSLAFVAGAVNAGGFLAVQAYTSHVTGTVSRVADEMILGHPALALAAVGIVTCFLAGAFSAGLLISLGKRLRFQSHYALSLMLEAALLLIFGFMGANLHQIHRFFVPLTAALLSFVMGMHNSVVTTISNAEVRTTHLTGIVTDIGLEASRLFYFNVEKNQRVGPVLANRTKLKLHSLILVSFFVGGLVGAAGFKHVGYKMTIFLAVFLILLAWRPLLQDMRIRFRLIRHPAGEAGGGEP
jgi:uncharacterized membrane protein YoaK (UPF0700 family)